MSKKTYNGSYPVLSLSITPSIKMERDELERFCQERNLPIFHLQVGETVDGLGVVESCKPYLKYFTFFEGHQFTATERMEADEEAKRTVTEVKP